MELYQSASTAKSYKNVRTLLHYVVINWQNKDTYYILVCLFKLQVSTWYEDFKKDYPELWKISEDAMKEIKHFAANPPDLTHMDHPIHPIRKIKK